MPETVRPDVYAQFRQALALDVVDIYSPLHAMQAQGAVVNRDLWRELGAQSWPEHEGRPLFAVVRFSEAEQVIRNPGVFTSTHMTAAKAFGPQMVTMDPPEHTANRSVVQSMFSASAVQHWEQVVIPQAVDFLIDSVADAKQADLVLQFGLLLPHLVVQGLLGLSDEETPDEFFAWATELTMPGSAELWQEGSAKVDSFISGIVEDKRKDELTDPYDFLGLLAHARVADRPMTEEEVNGFVKLLIVGGSHTTGSAFSSLMWALLHDEASMAAVRSDRSLIPQAIDEALRWEGPTTDVERLSLADSEVGGVHIPADSIVRVHLSAADRDDTRWPDPDRFDIFRPKKRHIAFGSGPHACIAQLLARAEVRAAVNRLLDRLPNLRLDPDRLTPPISGVKFRSLSQLHVVWD